MLVHLVLVAAADVEACGCLLPLGPSSAAGRGLRLLCFLASPKLLTLAGRRALPPETTDASAFLGCSDAVSSSSSRLPLRFLPLLSLPSPPAPLRLPPPFRKNHGHASHDSLSLSRRRRFLFAGAPAGLDELAPQKQNGRQEHRCLLESSKTPPPPPAPAQPSSSTGMVPIIPAAT